MMNWKTFLFRFIPIKSLRKKLKHELRIKEFTDALKAQVSVSCDIGCFDELLAKKTIFPHPVGIVISKHVKIGKSCIIYQNVTLGRLDYPYEKEISEKDYPHIGDNVIIYAGACVIGDVKIGNNAVIGANAVVLKDVPDGAVAVGVPAKIIRQ